MRILLLTADPTDTATRLRLQQELRVIQERLRANLRKTFQLEYRFSVRSRDIRQAILDFKPHIVHFSGHGTSTGELCLEDESGTIHSVKPKALADLFELVVADKVQVNCVVLNACYSDIQAKAIVKHIPFVIGMKQAIGDQAAIAFSRGFYRQLALNRSIEDAFKSGCVEIQLENIPEELTPVLHKKEDNLPDEEGFRRWLDSNGHDKSSLLRGQKLRIAMEWSAKNILTVEYSQFLNASQELEIKSLQYSRRIISGIAIVLFIGILITGFQLKEKIQSLFLPYVLDPELFSQRERDFFFGNPNYYLTQGIKSFEKKGYLEAKNQFEKAKKIDINNPEAEIFYNNAQAHEKGNYLSLAVVVPKDANKEMSKDVLRGVAQAQYEFNNRGGLKGPLLNIRIADDNNDPIQAQRVAHELTKDSNVLGVIGHIASTVSKAALPEYKNAGLAMISSSSTSTILNMKEFKVFFRTVPSDAIAGKKLVKYAINQNIKKVAIYYIKDDIYSESLNKAFASSFIDRGGELVRIKDLTNPNLDVSAELLLGVFQDKADAAVFFPKLGLIPIVINIARGQQNIPANLPKQKKLQLLGGDALYGADTLTEGKEAVEGLVLAVPWFAEKSNNFAERACTRWGGQVNWRTAASFDATQAFIKAMSQSDNPSRQTVLEKLKSIELSPDQTSGHGLKFIDGERSNEEPVLVKVVKGSGDRCGGFREGGFHFEKVPEK